MRRERRTNVAASDAALTDVLCAVNVTDAWTDLKDLSGLLIQTKSPRGLVPTPAVLPARPLNIRCDGGGFGVISDWVRNI